MDLLGEGDTGGEGMVRTLPLAKGSTKGVGGNFCIKSYHPYYNGHSEAPLKAVLYINNYPTNCCFFTNGR